MWSLAGETGAFCGVGEASGNGTSDIAELRERFALVLADAPTANAKLLSDKPAAHASAHALTARFLEYLGIIPSSGDWLTPPHARSKCLGNEHSKRTPHCAGIQLAVKE